MNDRIKELAKQANCTIDDTGHGEGNLEKFAELLIRDCAKYAHFYTRDTQELEDHYNENGWNELADDIKCCMIVNFGFEQ